MLSLINEIKAYLITKYKITRLDIAEKSVAGITMLIQVIIIALLSTVILIVASFTLANYLGNCLNNDISGFLITTGIDILLLLVFIIFRKALIIKPLSKILIKLLLTGDREEEADEEDDEI
jgi:heme/copper-type cytochrome/quinol oxidase subunit 3